MNYRFAVASPIVRALLGSLFVLFVVATFHCTIDHIPHIYCNSKDDCDQDPYRSCDIVHHTCYDADGGVPLGDMPELSGPDMFCLTSAQCADDAPICALQHCRACMGSSDDAECAAHNPMTPRCNTPTGTCVECLMSADCPAMMPVCNTATFTCRACQANSECTSGICKADGTCADPSDIAYVNKSIPCMDTMHTSSPTMPYCEVSYAAANAGKPYILVSASTTPYGMLTLQPTATAINLTIVGPAARGTATRAIIASSGVAMPAINVVTTATPLTLVLDGLEITGSASAGGMNGAGVQCAGNLSTITIKNSTVVNSGAEGVNSNTGCTLTLDSNIISKNANEGIKLSATTYVITNNIIDHNGGGGLAGVNITDIASMGTFAFNTVASNGGANTVEGGIQCPGTGTVTFKIENSIVAQNAHNPMTNGTQFLGKCVLSNVVTGPDTFSGANQAVPAFVSMADFHLDTSATGLTMNQACCIDQIASATTPNANHDVDDGPRPKAPGTKLDTGAHEAK